MIHECETIKKFDGSIKIETDISDRWRMNITRCYDYFINTCPFCSTRLTLRNKPSPNILEEHKIEIDELKEAVKYQSERIDNRYVEINKLEKEIKRLDGVISFFDTRINNIENNTGTLSTNWRQPSESDTRLTKLEINVKQLQKDIKTLRDLVERMATTR